MDIGSLLGDSGFNPMQLMQMAGELSSKLPMLENKLNTFLDSKEAEAKLKPDEILFHAGTRSKSGEMHIFGFVIKDKDGVMYVDRTAYRLNLSEWIEKIKGFLPPAS